MKTKRSMNVAIVKLEKFIVRNGLVEELMCRNVTLLRTRNIDHVTQGTDILDEIFFETFF
jgi:hypothetical protein